MLFLRHTTSDSDSWQMIFSNYIIST